MKEISAGVVTNYGGSGFLIALQVRIRCVDECPNLGINAFKPAMIDNFEQTGTKFKYPLSDDQVGLVVGHSSLEVVSVNLFFDESLEWGLLAFNPCSPSADAQFIPRPIVLSTIVDESSSCSYHRRNPCKVCGFTHA